MIENVYNSAKVGCVFCVVVGDWRSNHVFYDLSYETMKAFKEQGATYFDHVILNRKKVAKIKIMMPQAKKMGYTVKVHEHMIVFQKR